MPSLKKEWMGGWGSSYRGYVYVLKFQGGGVCPCCKTHYGGLCLPCKINGGIMSTYTRMSRGGRVCAQCNSLLFPRKNKLAFLPFNT